MSMTFAEASQRATLAGKLEALERKGTIRPKEQKWLDNFRENEQETINAIVETKAMGQGFKAEATINLDDEIYGAYKAAGDFVKNRDLQSAKEAYARYRDLVRQKNEMFKYAAPEEYSKGRAAGAGSTMAVGLGTNQGINLIRNAGVAKQMLTGAGSGAALASAPEFGEGEGGFINRMKNVGYLNPAIGGAAGGAAPVAGRAAEGLKNIAQNWYRGAQDGFQGQALRRVAKQVKNAEDSGTDVKAYLDSLGPEGMLADVEGAPQGLATGIATIQGQGSNTLRRNIINRSKGAGARIEADFDRLIDQPNAGFLASLANKQNKNEVISPMYEKAKASTKLFDVQDVREAITEASADASTRSKAAMDVLLKELGDDADINKFGTIPVTARKLHNVRVELNDTIDTAFKSGDTGVGTNLKVFLDKIDDKLDDIDGYAVARSKWAEASAVDRAIEDGMKAFSGGKASAISPKMLEAKLKKMTGAEEDAFRAGAREYIGALMGTSRNDAAAAWAEFGKSWNAEKLEMIIGRTNAQQVTRRLMAEAEFSNTRQRAIEGAQTAFRTEAKKSVGDLTDDATGEVPGAIGRGKRALFDAPINALIDEILYSNTRGNLNKQIGKILTLQGRERDQVVSTLLDEAARMGDKTLIDKMLNQFFTTAVGTKAIQTYTGNNNNGN
tara:strand:- start:2503 stop:4512 length:2010 start_codon:yes stop_codon:yes gene_type:complete